MSRSGPLAMDARTKKRATSAKLRLSFSTPDTRAGSAEFLHFKLSGSWFGNRRKAAEFLRNETLRYLLGDDSVLPMDRLP